MGVLMLALALGGCSTLRLGYNNAPSLALWWLDGYFDFDTEQSEHMRAALQGLHKWHRAQELPLFIELLQNLQTSAAQPVTGEQVCLLYGYFQTRVQLTAERLVPALADLAPTLQPAQLEHITREYDKRNRQWREEWLEGTPAEIVQRRVKKLVDRAESFYGTLESAQLAVLRTQLTQASYDGNLHYREMQRRQQDAVQLLRELRTAGAPEPQVRLRALVARSLHSPDPVYSQYQARFSQQSCAAIAALHNSTTTSQRLRLAQTLQDYQNDLRALAAP